MVFKLLFNTLVFAYSKKQLYTYRNLNTELLKISKIVDKKVVVDSLINNTSTLSCLDTH